MFNLKQTLHDAVAKRTAEGLSRPEFIKKLSQELEGLGFETEITALDSEDLFYCKGDRASFWLHISPCIVDFVAYKGEKRLYGKIFNFSPNSGKDQRNLTRHIGEWISDNASGAAIQKIVPERQQQLLLKPQQK